MDANKEIQKLLLFLKVDSIMFTIDSLILSSFIIFYYSLILGVPAIALHVSVCLRHFSVAGIKYQTPHIKEEELSFGSQFLSMVVCLQGRSRMTQIHSGDKSAEPLAARKQKREELGTKTQQPLQ